MKPPVKKTLTWICRYCKLVWPRSQGVHCPTCSKRLGGNLKDPIKRG